MSSTEEVSNHTMTLYNGHQMPTLAFKCRLRRKEFSELAELALKHGWRHFDTAWTYKTDKTLGDILNEWITQKKIKREDLFITAKLPARCMRPKDVKKSLKIALKNLKLDYLDLFLIHFPFGCKQFDGNPRNLVLDTTTDLVKIWKAMEKTVQQGKVRSIGLANFNIKQIERILAIAHIKPAVVQAEVHIYYQQRELIEFCKKNEIIVFAYCLLSYLDKFFGSSRSPDNLPDPEEIGDVRDAADSYATTEKVLFHRHLVEKGLAVAVRCRTPSEVSILCEMFDFSLTDEDTELLDSFDAGSRGCLFRHLHRQYSKHPEFPC